MKIGVIGSTSRIGKILVDDYKCAALNCDITDETSIDKAIGRHKPDVVVNLAGITNPDECEKPENMEKVLDVNFSGVRRLADASEFWKIPIVTISTDHVFSGKRMFYWDLKHWIKAGAYDDNYSRPVPQNFYGQSKLAAEMVADSYPNMKIIRTSYLFSRERIEPFQKSYPAFMFRSFMHVQHFAHALHEYLHRVDEMPQFLNISGSENVSWKTFMKAYTDKKVKYHYFDKKGNFAPRPKKAGLKVDLSRELGLPQYSYLDGIELCR